MTWDLASNKVMDIWAPIRPSCGWNDCQECWIMNVHRKICNDLSREAKFKDIKTQWYKLLKVISCLPPKTSPTPAIQQRLSQICCLFHIFAQMFSTTFRSSACCIKAATFHLKRQWKNIEYVFVPELTRKPHGNPSRRWAGPVTRIEHVKNGNLCCNALSRFYMGRGPWDWSDYVWLFLKLPPPNNNTN